MCAMRTDFRRADFAGLAEAWNRFFPDKYAVSEQTVWQRTVGCPVMDWGASFIETDDAGRVVGFVVVKRSPTPRLYAGSDPDLANLSAVVYTSAILGEDLVGAAKAVLRDRGVHTLRFGADSSHFFPGVPSECAGLQEFLTIQGFVPEAGSVDLERDLGDYEPPPGCLEKLGGDAVVRPIEKGDLDNLSAFFDREFPLRWKYDVFRQMELEGRSEVVDGLFVDEECEGFSFTQDWTAKWPIGGAVWHRDLGSNWGALGPIGVSARVRGRKLGGALLGASLLRLKERGCRRTIIDWTTLVGFYGKFGFEVSRSYTTLALKLDREV